MTSHQYKCRWGHCSVCLGLERKKKKKNIHRLFFSFFLQQFNLNKWGREKGKERRGFMLLPPSDRQEGENAVLITAICPELNNWLKK